MNDESQSTLSPDHFKWQNFCVKTHQPLEIDDEDFNKAYKKANGGDYWICLTAIHWRHEPYLIGAIEPGTLDNRPKAQALLNFTKNWEFHPWQRFRILYSKPENQWIKSSITSRELTFTDKGRERSEYLTIYNRGLDNNPNWANNPKNPYRVNQ